MLRKSISSIFLYCTPNGYKLLCYVSLAPSSIQRNIDEKDIFIRRRTTETDIHTYIHTYSIRPPPPLNITHLDIPKPISYLSLKLTNYKKS